MDVVDAFGSLSPRSHRASPCAGKSKSSSDSGFGEGGSEISFGDSFVVEVAIVVFVIGLSDIHLE